MAIERATFAESREAVRLLGTSLRGRDPAFERLIGHPLRGPLATHISLPLYFHTLNEGWVLRAEGRAVGWLYLRHRASLTLINQLLVHPDHLRMGIGARLLAWAATRAREKRRAALLLAVGAPNAPAQSLYTSAGFRALPHHHWRGGRWPRAATGRARELDPAQRYPVFQAAWRAALERDRHPAALLDEPRVGGYTKQGRAWELYDEGASPGYAQLAGGSLRLIAPDHPDPAALLGALRTAIPGAPPALTFGSARSERRAIPSLERCGWQRAIDERMWMALDLSGDDE